MIKMLHEHITDKILASAVAVHKSIGPGLTEQSIAVTYKGTTVGHHRPDFVVENAVVVELKVVRSFEPVFFRVSVART